MGVWRPEVLDLRYVDESLAKVILPSYKETSRGKIPRRVKIQKSIKSSGKLQLMVEKYQPKEDRVMSLGQENKKAWSGRAHKIQGQCHTMIWLLETSMHCEGVLKYTMHTWNILEDCG